MFCDAAPPPDALAIVMPVIVVEVLSPSTARRDVHDELIGYFRVPSVCHDLVVDAERRGVIHHARRGDEIATRILHAGALRFDPPGMALRIEDLYGGRGDEAL